MKYIQIWYSWREQESPVEVPEGTDAWEFMQKIAAKEVFVSQEDCPYGCTVWADSEEGMVTLKYHHDGEYCYYLITDEEDYDPFDK